MLFAILLSQLIWQKHKITARYTLHGIELKYFEVNVIFIQHINYQLVLISNMKEKKLQLPLRTHTKMDGVHATMNWH